MARRGNGEGTITRRRDGRWEGRYTIDTADGPKRKTLYGKTRKEVAEKLATALADRNRGVVFDADELRVAEWLESWLQDSLSPLVAADKMAHSTYVRYEGIVNLHLSPAIGHRKLKNLSRAEVRRLYREKAEHLSPRSVDYIHVTLQKALSQAMVDDLIPRNVAAGERPRSTRTREEIKALSSGQAATLVEAAASLGTRNESLFVVALHTGLRQGELLGFQWKDIDLEGRRLSVRRALKPTENGLDFGPPKNKASRRAYP